MNVATRLLHVNLIQDLPVFVCNELTPKFERRRQFPCSWAPFIRDQPEAVNTFGRIETLIHQVDFIVENACYFGMPYQFKGIIR